METTNNLSPDLLRVVDANLNRLKEGIRVVEDILRYKDNNTNLAKKLKSLRHLAITEDTKKLLQHRDSINDVLRPSTLSEQTRTNLENIIIANFKRAQESSRVLEELYKLENIEYSEKFKTIRYELYNLEKEILLD
ncbi:thiamine-phosphate pyrophosphorylase [Sulfurimonas sp.]|uniref:thiamine-phosphate pyrophosphorylase n=1 Tax=Sulfurimonas sp. TaxID=2022749 RepID=UPI003D1165C5